MRSSDDLLLSLVWALPLAGALLVLLAPRRWPQVVRVTSLVVCSATFVLTLVLLALYLGLSRPADGSIPTLAERAPANVLAPAPIGAERTRVIDAPNDLVVRHPWVPYANIQYYLGVDGISLSLLVLTGLVSVLACLASWNIDRHVRGYFALFLALLASMMGVFLALDLVLFFVFFEFMLLPMYFLIAVWGGEQREYAALKFLLYTLAGSVLILVAVLVLYFWADAGQRPTYSFDLIDLTARSAQFGRWAQGVVFLLLFLGFAVKLPSLPFHTWLPDAHVQAPTPISMILAGILLKVGGYGFVRLAWPLAPLGAQDWCWPVAVLGVVSILYGALVAMAQTDFKKLVAYSSVSHMGYVTLGMAAMNLGAGSADPRYYAYGATGAMFMMIAHGITSAAMFFLVGVIYERAHTRDLDSLGGLLPSMPSYGAVSFLIFFGSMGLPGLCGFVAEVLVVLAAFHYSIVLGVLTAAAVVLTAGYILWTLQRVFLGQTSPKLHGLPYPDLTAREWAISLPLVALTIALGLFPHQTLLGWMGPSVDTTVRAMAGAIQAAGPEAAAPRVAVAVAAPTPTPMPSSSR
jgi:NADH-quinone oxidoreductase subunit M